MTNTGAGDERVHLLKLHPTSRGLSREALEDVAASAELLRLAPGDFVQRGGEPVTAVYLIVHGRLRVRLPDAQRRLIMDRFHGAGQQFGGIAAALGESSPLECVAADPSTLLKIDYPTCLELTRRHDVFRLNFARAMAESVKQTIYNERCPFPPRIVAFMHQSDDTRIVSERLFQRLAEYGEQISVVTDQASTGTHDRIVRGQILGGDRDWTPEEVRSWAASRLESGRVFIDVSTAVDPVRAANTMERGELILWCVTPQNWEASASRLREIEAHAPGWRDKVRIVWLLEGGERAPAANELLALAGRHICISFGPPAANQGRVVSNGFERLVHLVRGIQIGLALGGGAARGMAHLGVLKALEQNGIVVDMIAGTSAGAMTGTLYAAGLDPDYLIRCFVHDLTPSWIFRCLPRGEQWDLLCKYRLGRFDPMLRKYLGDLRIEQLPTPMHTVTVDLIRGESVVRSAGDAVHGVLESINLPVLSKPIFRPGQALVDGGLINNIPADVLVAKGCNFVIAVSVTAKMDSEFARNRPDTPLGKMRSPSTIQTVLRSFLVQSTSVNAIGVQPADFVIEPDVSGFELSAFTRTGELAAIGEQATLAAVPQIKSLLQRMDAELFLG